MVNYTCNNCNKTFTRKSDFIYHTEKKKKPCKLNTDVDPHKPAQVPHKTAQIVEKNDKLKNTSDSDSNNHSDTEIKHICTFCKDQFTRQDSLKRHIDKYCKVKKKEDKLIIIDEIEQLKKKFEEKILEIEKQSKELCELKKEIDTTTKGKLKTINNTTNTNNIVVNNVLTGPFDKENLIKTLKFIESNKELKEKTKWINFSKGYCLSLYDETRSRKHRK